jgi:hypothetical protein
LDVTTFTSCDGTEPARDVVIQSRFRAMV